MIEEDTIKKRLEEVLLNAQKSDLEVAREPFEESYGDEKTFVIVPTDDGEITKTVPTVIETGTLLDGFFRLSNEQPLFGIPISAQIGLVGQPDVGKSILVQELALRLAEKGIKVLFVTSEDMWVTGHSRFDLQSRMKDKATKMGQNWNKIKENLRVFDTIQNNELRDWRVFVKNYRKVRNDFGFTVMIMDSITMIEESRTKLKARMMELARFNQKEGITAFYVCQRSSDDPDSYAVAGGIGLPHNFDVNICIDRIKAGGQVKADLNFARPNEDQIKQWDLVHFIRVMGCRLCGFDRRYYEVDITTDGFLKLKASQNGEKTVA